VKTLGTVLFVIAASLLALWDAIRKAPVKPNDNEL